MSLVRYSIFLTAALHSSLLSGNTALGYDFGALEDPNSPLLVNFDFVMKKLSNPVFAVSFSIIRPL
jgi:hypothetical protein